MKKSGASQNVGREEGASERGEREDASRCERDGASSCRRRRVGEGGEAGEGNGGRRENDLESF